MALAALVLAWASPEIGLGATMLLSAAVIFYFLFQAPVWCGAVTRDGMLCRRNSSGLLMGCSLRQHKWQRARMAIVPHAWRRLNDGLWDDPKTSLATMATMVGIASGVVSLVLLPFA
jgi:hypothetical protein